MAMKNYYHITRRSFPLVLCADFDETITTKDTIHLLFQLAGASTLHQANSNALSHEALVRQLVDQYTSEMDAFAALYEHSLANTAADNVQREKHRIIFDGDGLRKFLEGYAATDLRSLQRVIAAKALMGIREDELTTMAIQEIDVRDGCVEVLDAVDGMYVISSNWSGRMVQAKLLSMDPFRERYKSNKLKIVANDLEVNDDGITTGGINIVIQSPVDKAAWVDKIRDRSIGFTNASKEDPTPVVVFIGDSTNDLLAMANADVGISFCTAPDSSFYKTAVRYGVILQPLTQFKTIQDCVDASHDANKNGGKVVFLVNNWSEIRAMLRGS